MQVALGPDADPRLLDAALLLYSGAMLQAGLGYFTFDQVVARMGPIVAMWTTDESPRARRADRDTPMGDTTRIERTTSDSSAPRTAGASRSGPSARRG